jgi:biopolymer transport protein ExbB
MVPIVLGSVAALAIFLERCWILRRERVIPRALGPRVRELVEKHRLEEAESVCREDGSALAAVLRAGLRDAGQPRSEIKETVNEAGRREVSRLERHVELLGTIAAAEPLLGLLGTVTGLIGAFRAVETLAAKGVGVNPGALASGIWEALITTAAGLIIGIPAYAGYRYLQGRIDAVAVEMEDGALELARRIARREAEGPGASTSRSEEAPA